jgi:predicted dinucleotide-binding enzyme
MRIGIVGSDDRALAIGRLLAEGGHAVTLSDPSDRERAKRAAQALHVGATTPYAQGVGSEILILATAPIQIDATIRALGSTPPCVVVDAIAAEHGNVALSGSELLAHKLDTHRLVRALIGAPKAGANVPLCGDDDQSKSLVEQALRACGCIVTDRGVLARATELEAPLVA